MIKLILFIFVTSFVGFASAQENTAIQNTIDSARYYLEHENQDSAFTLLNQIQEDYHKNEALL
jgi:hypothetical protein